ncbi:MAG: hypothetical protein HKN84_00195 [Gammaproteobacteria bacterium]|nr:hypothetical protein [Gammaproteobacteria bacterium]
MTPTTQGQKTLTGIPDANRLAAVMLEVLSGERGPHDGCAALGISLSRYYVLETRALQGLITALEPRPKGRQKRPEDTVRELERERGRLRQELSRSQALLRASQRSIGLPSSKPSKRGKVSKTTRKRRRRIVRAKSAIAALKAESPQPTAPSPEPQP